MKRNRLTYLFLVLSCSLFYGSAFAQMQIMPPDLYQLQVYPIQPTATDSVFVSLTYTSNDGCPDYFLVKESADSSNIYVATRKIDNSRSICTMLFSKFVTKINLGILSPGTKIFVDSALIKIINPICMLDKKGVVVMGTGDCSGKLLISEHTPYMTLLPVLYSMDNIIAKNSDGSTSFGFKPGDEVKFGARPATNPTCRIVGEAVCCELIGTPPTCLMNKTGEVVPGIDGCTGQWFVKDLSPVYSYPRLYLFKNDGNFKAGTKMLFGTTDYVIEPNRSVLCPVFGIVTCFAPAEPLLPDTLSGTAFTGDSILKGGTAILFQKGIKRALRANPLRDGRFEFPNLPSAEYTVYIIPDRRLNPNYLPTFYINKLAFRYADYFELKDGMNEIAVNMRKFERRPGKGRIFGNIYFEHSNLKDSVLNYYGDKNSLYTTNNTTAVNLPVLLFNAMGAPIAWTISDESGNYAFEDLALDSYKIVSETAETEAESNVSLSQYNAAVGVNMVLKVPSIIDELPTTTSDAFSMYPNPVSNKLYIQTASNNITARIYNSLGQLMLERALPIGTNELDVQYLNQGIYLVKIGSQTQKLIRR